MEKVKELPHIPGRPDGVEIKNVVSKINEIVDWINENESKIAHSAAHNTKLGG